MCTKFVAFIPARGGSKGILHKNIKEFKGIPLIAHTIIAAKKASYISEVYVSTDCMKIAEISKLYGAQVPFIRPSEISGDRSGTIDAVLHFAEYLSNGDKCFENLVLLQPTSPLRCESNIDEACGLFLQSNCESLASVTRMKKPKSLIRDVVGGGLVKAYSGNSAIRRQDAEFQYYINGAIYINGMDRLSKDTVFNDNKTAYIMDYLHSIDIDEPFDLEEASLHWDMIHREEWM